MPREKKVNKNQISRIPKKPGVYFFYDKNKKVLYIGKAVNLQSRVKNHFSQPTYRDNFFINETKKIGYIPLSSEIEALILESQLIKKKQPKFNILFRDDKKYFYVGITQPVRQSPKGSSRLTGGENWPRVFITHQPTNKQLTTDNKRPTTNDRRKKIKKPEIVSRKSKVDYIGPFTDGASLKETLKILRKIFPFKSCIQLPRRSCLWYDLGRCPAPCLIEKEKNIRETLQEQTKEREKEYKKNVKKLKEILGGEKKKVINNFRKEMQGHSKKEEFENAAKIRDKIEALERVFSHKIIIERQENYQKTENEGKILKNALSLPRVPKKIEGYDVSNIKSNQMVGAMTSFKLNNKKKYVPDRKNYRLFKIKTVKKQNDIACLKEIISRRLGHDEWKKPDLIYVDGGKAQFNAASGTIRQNTIPIISLAKKTNILYTNILNKFISLNPSPLIKVKELDKLDKVAKMTILRIKDESHRFAISYHKRLRKKHFLNF